jgi:hypothetical protein
MNLISTRAALAASLAVLALGATACGGGSGSASTGTGGASSTPAPKEVNPAGDIPDDQAFVAYSPPSCGCSVKVPEGWSRSQSGGAVTFTDKLNAVRMETAKAPSAVTVGQAQQTLVPELARSVKGFKLGSVSTVTRPAGKAVRITYTADAAKDPVTGRGGTVAVERYLFAHNGRELTLTLSGAKGADNVDPWKIVSSSVRWTA